MSNPIPQPNAILYTEDMLNANMVSAIAASGFTTVIVGLFHVHDDGSLYYNDDAVDATTAAIIKTLKSTPGSKVKTVLFSIGGGNWAGHPASVSDSDYPAMKKTWNTPAPGATKTSKQNILDFLKDAQLDGLDLDYEPVTTPFDTAFIAQITNEISAKGYIMTAAPYQDISDWETVLKSTAIKTKGSPSGNNFSWWNLQIYSGAMGANYPNWVSHLNNIKTEIGLTSSEIEAFIVPGYKPDCGTMVGVYIAELKQNYPNLNGGFIWRYKFISNCLAAQASSILNAAKG